MNTAAQKYGRDTALSFTAYGIMLMSANFFLATHGPDGWIPIALAFALVLPILYFVRALVVFSRSFDELQKQIHLEATLVAVFAVGLVTFTYGFLQDIGFPPLDISWVLPMLIATQGVSLFFVSRKYK